MQKKERGNRKKKGQTIILKLTEDRNKQNLHNSPSTSELNHTTLIGRKERTVPVASKMVKRKGEGGGADHLQCFRSLRLLFKTSLPRRKRNKGKGGDEKEDVGQPFDRALEPLRVESG